MRRSTKKRLQQPCALLATNAAGDLAAVIERLGLEKIDPAARRAALHIRAAENHAPQPGVDERAGAHRAGLFVT